MTAMSSRGVQAPVITIALLALLGSARAAESESAPVQLSSAMTPEEFARSGVTKLSDSERAVLEAWITRYAAGRAEDPSVLPEKDAAQKIERIDARILGDFSGWSGQTVFMLDNGQVWHQRLPGKYRYSGPPNPAVVISKNFLGFYVLTIGDTNRGIGVERVK